eukprot:Em0018g950a
MPDYRLIYTITVQIKLVHISGTTPPSLSSEALRASDGETRSCFSTCLAADVTEGLLSTPLVTMLCPVDMAGDTDIRHNILRDIIADLCRKAHLPVRVEAGHVSLKESSRFAGVAALSAEMRKHAANDPKCRELGWMCIPMAVEMYASRLATCSSKAKSVVLTELYGRLNLHLVRANAIAILASSLGQSDGTAAGPSGLRVQHLIDAAQIPLPIPISTTLRDVINLLAAGKAPLSVARFLAGGSLTALNKFRHGSPPDLGVACPHGTEKVVHGLRKCTEEHWGDEDFAVLKTDMRNTFNLISRQALLSECSLFFPELLPWAGVQQGDPLGPLFFSLVLHKVIAAIDADDDCLRLILQAWYLDDGVLAGPKHAVLRALSIFEDLGPSLGIFINLPKCELFSHSDISMFPHVMKASHVPHLDILGTPIGDYLYCTGFFAAKHVQFTKLLSKLEDVSVIDPQVAFNMLHLCSGFCKIVHLARSTPPSVAADSLKRMDSDANLSVKVEAGSTLTPDLSRSRLVDALVSNWSDGISTPFDITGTSPLTPVSLQEASVTTGTAALLAERRKHQTNDPKCHMLGRKCTPLAVESYGSWGSEARQVFSHLASRLSFGVGILKPKILVEIYGKLNIALMRCNARALSRECNLV